MLSGLTWVKMWDEFDLMSGKCWRGQMHHYVFKLIWFSLFLLQLPLDISYMSESKNNRNGQDHFVSSPPRCLSGVNGPWWQTSVKCFCCTRRGTTMGTCILERVCLPTAPPPARLSPPTVRRVPAETTSSPFAETWRRTWNWWWREVVEQ